MKLGEKIKQLRNDAGLTQPELAEKAQIEQSYLSKLENDKGTPSFDVISKIANAFNIEVMSLIDSLDMQYLQESLKHLPEIALKLESRRVAKQQRMRKSYIISALAIVLGVALVVLGNSTSIVPETTYEYKSMGLIQKGELNSHFQTHSIRAIAETRDQQNKRVADNIVRINEKSLLTTTYRGEGFIDIEGNERRYFEMRNERHVESPWRELFSVMGMMLLVGGGFGMSYTFKFIK
jgi:transcriptional regulator with XRE-family HTH domain